MSRPPLPLHRILARFQQRTGWTDTQMTSALGTSPSTYADWLAGVALPHHCELNRWAAVLRGVYTTPVLRRRLAREVHERQQQAVRGRAGQIAYAQRVRLLSVYAVKYRAPVDPFGLIGPPHVDTTMKLALSVSTSADVKIDVLPGVGMLRLPVHVLRQGTPACVITIRHAPGGSLVEWQHREATSLMIRLTEISLQSAFSVYPTEHLGKRRGGAVLALFPWRIMDGPIRIEYPKGCTQTFIPGWSRRPDDTTQFP